MNPILFLNLQQNLVQMLLFYILRKISKNPRVYQCFQRAQPCLRIYHQYLLQKHAQLLVLYERIQSLTRGNDGLPVFSLDDLRRKIFVEIFLSMLTVLQVLLRRGSEVPHDKTDLFLLILASKERKAQVKLCQQTAKTPNIDGEVVLCPEYHLRSSVKPRLYIQKVGLIDEHTRPEIDDLDTDLRMVLHEHVFRLQIAMNHTQLLEEGKRSQQLNGKSSDIVSVKRSEVVRFEKLVKIGGQDFCDYANMLPKDDEVLDAQQVLTILDVLLLDLHQNVDLVERQLHVLPPRTHDLHSHCLPRFVVERLHHFSERAAPEPLQQLVPVAHLLVLLPEVPALEVVLPHAAPDSYVVDGLFVDQLDALVLGQHRLEALQDLLAGQAGQRPSEVLVVKQLRLLYQGHFLLHFFEVLGAVLVDGGALLVNLDLAVAVFLGCGGLAGGGGRVEGLLSLLDTGVAQVLAVGLGRVVALGGRVVEEESGLRTVPCVGFIVFIKFDFEVDLHENNNNSILQVIEPAHYGGRGRRKERRGGDISLRMERES